MQGQTANTDGVGSDMKSEKLDRVKRYSLAISIIALMVTGLSFYYTNIYESHSLKLAIGPLVTNITRSIGEPFKIDTVFLNQGNRDEAVMQLRLVLNKSDNNTYEVANKGPILVKAKTGEAAVLIFNTNRSVRWGMSRHLLK
jgi:hypothetical protein